MMAANVVNHTPTQNNTKCIDVLIIFAIPLKIFFIIKTRPFIIGHVFFADVYPANLSMLKVFLSINALRIIRSIDDCDLK